MTMAMNFRNKRGWEGAPLLWQLVRRNRAWMGLIFILTFAALPLQYMLAIFTEQMAFFDNVVYGADAPSIPYAAPNFTPARIFTELSMLQFGVVVTAAAILVGLWQTRWLRSKRQGEFWYSLPVDRRDLLLAHAGAAWLTIALPLAADYLVVLLAGAARLAQSAGREGDYFLLPVGEILLDLFGWLVTALAVIAIIFLVSVMTGGFFKTLILSGALMGALPMAAAFLDLAIRQFIVGWFGGGYIQELVQYSTPVFVMPMRYGSYNTFWGTYPALANWMLLVWLAIGLFCLWPACRVFRDRPVEMAGTGAVREPLGLVVTFLATLAGGLTLGLLFWNSIYPRPSFLLTVVLCSLGAAVLCQVILKWDLKTLRTPPDLRGLGKVLPFLALCMVLPVTAAYIVTHGGLGYEDYIPPVGEVQEVRVRYRGRYGTLAKRLDHLDESVHPAETGENWYSLDGSELPADLWKTWYSYNDHQYVYLTTPEGIGAAEDLHRSLLEQQKQTGEGRKGLLGSIDFLYNDEIMRIYGQRTRENDLYESPRDLTALLALEEDPEFRRQTDPRFTVTAGEIRAIRVSDDLGLTTSNPITDRETIERLVAAMRADAETFDYSSFRKGTAQAAAYLTIETTAPTPWYRIPTSQPGETTVQVTEDLWRDFCLPVYREDQKTLDALWASGLGEYTGQFLSQGKVTGLQVNWWGDAGWNEEAYWTGIGPRDLWPGNEAWPPEAELRESAAALLVTDPQQMEELLALCRGNDCHISEHGFTVTILGGDRTGSTFWLAAQEEAPGFIQNWYLENERTLRSSWGQRFQYLP